MKSLSAIFLLLFFLSGCKTDGRASAFVLVYEDKGALQCEPDSALTATDSAAKLSDARVDVVDSYCSYKTGVMYPAACGMGTPDILIHRIAEADLRMAQLAGFSLIDAMTLPEQGIRYEMAECDAT